MLSSFNAGSSRGNVSWAGYDADGKLVSFLISDLPPSARWAAFAGDGVAYTFEKMPTITHDNIVYDGGFYIAGSVPDAMCLNWRESLVKVGLSNV